MRRGRSYSKVGIGLVIIVVLLLIVFVASRIITLKREVDNKQAELAKINTEISAAEEERLDIENEIRYRETDEYLEDQAKELGLRYPDEMIIVPEDGN